MHLQVVVALQGACNIPPKQAFVPVPHYMSALLPCYVCPQALQYVQSNPDEVGTERLPM